MLLGQILYLLCIKFFIYKYNQYSSRTPAIKHVDKPKLTLLDSTAVGKTITKSWSCPRFEKSEKRKHLYGFKAWLGDCGEGLSRTKMGRLYDITVLDYLAHWGKGLEGILDKQTDTFEENNISSGFTILSWLNMFWDRQLRYVSLVLNTGKVIYVCIQYFFSNTRTTNHIGFCPQMWGQ